jgi:hypothetical protein
MKFIGKMIYRLFIGKHSRHKSAQIKTLSGWLFDWIVQWLTPYARKNRNKVIRIHTFISWHIIYLSFILFGFLKILYYHEFSLTFIFIFTFIVCSGIYWNLPLTAIAYQIIDVSLELYELSLEEYKKISEDISGVISLLLLIVIFTGLFHSLENNKTSHFTRRTSHTNEIQQQEQQSSKRLGILRSPE